MRNTILGVPAAQQNEPAVTAFMTGWNDIINNGNVTVGNLNALINNFKLGTFAGPLYDNHGTDNIDDLTKVFIDNLKN